MFDYDNDGDEDILYLMNGVLYFKENLSTEDDKIYLKENSLVISAKNNKFVSKDFIEAPNNFTSYVSTNQIINVSFSSTPNVYNYKLSFYDVVDKFWNEENPSYTPRFRKKQIVDAVA
jgi:hypothetical protein